MRRVPRLVRAVWRRATGSRVGNDAVLEPVDTAGRRVAPGVDLSELHKRNASLAGLDDQPTVFTSAGLTNPETVPTSELDLAPGAWVVGVASGGESRAYPLSPLGSHHVINDVVGEPVVITFCFSCRSGVVFDPVVDGEHLLFETFGLYKRNLTMTDRQTNTIWSQMTGEALVGDLVGSRLTVVPYQICSAAQWIEDHPDSRSPQALRSDLGQRDQRRLGLSTAAEPRTDPIALGLVLGDRSVAYRVDHPIDEPLCVQDSFNGFDLVLLAKPWSIPNAYSSRIDGERILFEASDGRAVAAGSTWSHDGIAVDGPYAGRRLELLPSRPSRWERWVEFHPNSELRSLRAMLQ